VLIPNNDVRWQISRMSYLDSLFPSRAPAVPDPKCRSNEAAFSLLWRSWCYCQRCCQECCCISTGSSKPQLSADAIQSQASSQPNLPAETKIVTNSDAGGKVVRQALPNVSKSSLQTIHGTIRVNVTLHVNAAGTVESVQVESAGPSNYFANKASEAAKQWKFELPMSNGKSVPSQWSLEFQFKRTATTAHAVQVAPEPS
jgi:TonB family protein